MATVLIATLLVFVTLVLFLTPLTVPVVRQNLSFLNIGAAFAITVTVLSFVLQIAASAGVGVLLPLRVTAIVLIVCAVIALVIWRPSGVRTLRIAGFSGSAMIVLIVALGIWSVIPAYVAIASSGAPFGVASAFNWDPAHYLLVNNNLASTGFDNSGHFANGNIGQFAAGYGYPGASAIQITMAAITGLANWQVTMATMSVAVCFMAIALIALASEIWPRRPRVAVVAGVLASLIPLVSYTVANYFLGGIVGVACLALCLAAATRLARTRKRWVGAAIALTFAISAGIFSYPVLLVPAILALPLWIIAVRLITRSRISPSWGRLIPASVAVFVVGTLLAAPAYSTALSTLKNQAANTDAGWPIAPMSAFDILLFWRPFTSTTAGWLIVASWLAVAILIMLAMVFSWRRGAQQSVVISMLLLVGVVLLALAISLQRGAGAYSSWKMLSFLAPIGVAAVAPAFGNIRTSARRVGATALLAVTCVAALAPWFVWSTLTPDLTIGADAADLADAKQLRKLEAVNVKLDQGFENMAVAAIIPTNVVVVSGTGYYPEKIDPNTCTLVTAAAAKGTPHETINPGYALIPFPAPCQRKD